jgi:hypothetical protein
MATNLGTHEPYLKVYNLFVACYTHTVTPPQRTKTNDSEESLRADSYSVLCKTNGSVISYHDYEGQLHRLDGPAYKSVIAEDWYYHGKLHRIGGPASVDNVGQQWWYHYGSLHRLDGPAFTDKVGGQWWYVNGQLHRLDGPAEITGLGSFRWHRKGKLHRIDGPAVQLTNGDQLWYVNDRQLTAEEFYRYVDQLTGEVFVPPGKKLQYDRK